MSQQRIQASALSLLLLLTSACGDRQQESAEDMSIIGNNDLTPTGPNGERLPEKYRRIINAFGLVSMGCTATHIGNGLAITAGHCFQKYMSPQRKENVSCKETSIKWGFRKDAPASFESQCDTIIASEWNLLRDYALLRLNNTPPVSVSIDLSSRPMLNAKITIFGYPQGRPLEWSSTCTVLPFASGSNAEKFSHECDTEPGSSGSAILDDSSLKIVGIHNGFSVPLNYGTYLVGSLSEKITASQR